MSAAPVSRLIQLRPLFVALLLSGLVLGACNCDTEQLTPAPGSCDPTYECPPGFEYRLGGCREGRCTADSDCCPGQKCNAAAGFCANLLDSKKCTQDQDCRVVGQRCIAMKGGRFCGYPNKGNVLSQEGTQSCLTNDDCDPDRGCFAHRCVNAVPCGGGCPPGSVCDLDSDTCYEMPSCTLDCEEGQMLAIDNPDTMSGDKCCAVACKCETLPPLPPGQFGWYASLTLAGDDLTVSAYDPGYTDLVVATYDLTGARKLVEYVDGVPTTGSLVGNPTGPRGGRGEPGPNIGEHTSITVDAAGVLHVAYYDRDQGALKYANRSGGKWVSMVVDDQGDVGRYTSIAIAPDGSPRIAYMMADGTVPPDPTPKTALKLATAHTNLPAATSDWTAEVIDSQLKPPLVCGGGCPRDQACIDFGSGPSCVPTVTGCNNCGSGEACVATGTTSKCQERINAVPLDDLVEGTGLFTSLALTSTGTPVIAYYDRIAGDLRFAQGNGAGGYILRTLDGNDPQQPADVGQHASLAIGPGDLVAIAYVDATEDDLVYLELRPGAPTREVVDEGISPPDLLVVGADASLVFDSGGRPAIAYQDATNINLLYARRLGSPAMWSTEVLRGAAGPGTRPGTASGFYVDQVRKVDDAFVLSVDVGFTPDSELLLTPVITKKRLD